MPVKTCPKCKKEFEYEKHVCPHCGYDLWAQADFLKMFISDPRYRRVMYYLSGFFAIVVTINIGLWWLKTAFPDIGQHVDTTYLKFIYNVTGIISDYAFTVFIAAVMILSFMGKKATEITSSKATVTTANPSVSVKKADHKIIWFFAIFAGLTFILIAFLIFVMATEDETVNSNQPAAEITDFVSCAAAGNPVMESYPRQCRANGQTFVEIIKLAADSQSPAAGICAGAGNETFVSVGINEDVPSPRCQKISAGQSLKVKNNTTKPEIVWFGNNQEYLYNIAPGAELEIPALNTILEAGVHILHGSPYSGLEIWLEIGQVACTAEAKLCPDGSAVGRTGPNCEFSPCPVVDSLLTEADARLIAEKSCIKGGEALSSGTYNANTQTWWFDANLNATKEGCNPACVVNELTKTAEINWRCTGLVEQKGKVSGQVLLGPTCPVQRIPPDPACADKPYQTTIQVIATGSPSGAPYTTVQSNTQGFYEISLPAGEYALQPVGGSVLPRCETVEVIVTNLDQTINLSCDTGIR